MFKFWSCLSSLVPGSRGRNFDSRCYLKLILSPLCMLHLHNLQFCSVVSEKQLSILLEKGQSHLGLVLECQLQIGTGHRASLIAQLTKNTPAVQETLVPSRGWEDPLEKG